MDVLCARLLERTLPSVGADAGLVTIPQGEAATTVARAGLPAMEAFPHGCGLAQRCLSTGQPLHAERALVPPEGLAFWVAHALESALALPLRSPTGVVEGALVLYARRPRAFDEATQARVAVLGEALASLLDRRGELEVQEARRLASVEASERRFQAFMAAVPMVAFIKDEQDRYVWMNARYEQLLGVRAEDLVGRTDAFHLPPEVVAEVQANDRKVRQERVVLNIEEHVPVPGEGPRTWLSTKFPILTPEGTTHVGGLAYDLTKLRTAETKAQQLQARMDRAELDLRAVVDAMGEPVNLMRGERLLYANPAMTKLLGLKAEEVLGRSILEFVVPEEVPSVRSSLETFKDGERRSARRHIRRATGEHAVVDVVATKLPLGEDSITVSVLRDVTERLRAEQEAQLTARLASIGTLSAGVAHEINNPLAYVMANLKLISDALQGPEGVLSPQQRAELSEMAEDALHGVERIRRIVAGLRTLGRQAHPATAGVIDPRRVVTTALDLTANEIRHRARLQVDLQPVPGVRFDETELAQVLVNLLTNATQAIPMGMPDQHLVRVQTLPDEAGNVVVVVTDDGSGIKPEHLPRIFDPFFTTRPANSGMGLGLSLTHGLVTRNGGTISVSSAVGVGTTFRVVLPAAGEPVTARATGKAPAALHRTRARLLVVDDDSAVRQMLERLLSRTHDVSTAPSAEAAWALVSSGAFDAVLCDLMMPGVDGLGFLAGLKTRAPALADRLAFLTGGAFTAALDAALHASGRPVLHKPATEEELLRMVDELRRG